MFTKGLRSSNWKSILSLFQSLSLRFTESKMTLPNHSRERLSRLLDTPPTSSVSNRYQNVPLIVIIGATGCGKTKLSIELAQRYGGEVISADSMQIYKGLDIATNKATPEEQSQAPHHLLDLVDPLTKYSVLEFQSAALAAIDSILDRQKIPIIVGGTNYYIESIVWDTLVGSAEPFNAEKNQTSDNQSGDECATETDERSEVTTIDQLMAVPISFRNLLQTPTERLYHFLTELDPVYASTLHPNDRRKVIRALQVYQQTGQRFSDILQQQRANGSKFGGVLRFSNAVILWVDCEKTVLEQRLSDRVNQMLKLGLVEELLDFHRNYNQLRLQQNREPDYTEGIFQAIGFKEFHPYLTLPDDESRHSYDGSLVLGRGILLLKERTSGYVSRQLKWIRHRFLVPRSVRAVPPVFRLDTTEPNRWEELVFDRATQILDRTVDCLLESDPSVRQQIWSQELSKLCANDQVSDEGNTETPTETTQFPSSLFRCDLCQTTASGQRSFQMHLKSKKHAFHLKKQKDEAEKQQTPQKSGAANDTEELSIERVN